MSDKAITKGTKEHGLTVWLLTEVAFPLAKRLTPNHTQLLPYPNKLTN